MHAPGPNFREYWTARKTTWGDGSWQTEPDKIQWIDPETQLDCLIVRNQFGALCGYVGVPEGHPLFGKDYDSIESGVDVHGGLTFADTSSVPTQERYQQTLSHMADAQKKQGHYSKHYMEEWQPWLASYELFVQRSEARDISHVPAPGRPDSLYWFGFDCAHSGDLAPGMWDMTPNLSKKWGDNYRPMAYVVTEVRQLAFQLATIATGKGDVENQESHQT